MLIQPSDMRSRQGSLSPHSIERHSHIDEGEQHANPQSMSSLPPMPGRQSREGGSQHLKPSKRPLQDDCDDSEMSGSQNGSYANIGASKTLDEKRFKELTARIS